MRLGIAAKLALVCSAFTLPIAVMLALVTRTELRQMSITALELRGDAVERPLEDALASAARHHALVDRARRGEDNARAIVAEESQMALALGRFEVAVDEHGAALKLTRADVEALRATWQAAEDAPSDAVAARHSAVIEATRALLARVGDSSNLILDAQLDTYYMMDLSLLALPAIEARIDRIRAETAEITGRGAATAKDRTALAAASALLRDVDWPRIDSSAQAAIHADPAFQGVSATLVPRLLPHLRRGGELVRGVDAKLDAVAESATSELDLQALDADLDALAAELHALHADALAEENDLLVERAAALRHGLYVGWSLAAFALLASATLAFFLSRSLVRRVLTVARATDLFARGTRAPMGAQSDDEVGDLARSFDAMVTRIDELTADVVAHNQQLERGRVTLELAIQARTKELSARNEEMALVLDNAQEGMLTIDLHGVMAGAHSTILERWFGPVAPGDTLQSYLRRHHETLADELEVGLDQLRDDVLPRELALLQLPNAARVGEQHMRFSYQPVVEGAELKRLLVVISDASAEIQRQRVTATQEETLRIFNACQRDREGFVEFFGEASTIVERIASGVFQHAMLRRSLHTLKGNCALFGVLSIASLCHEIETRLEDDDGVLSSADAQRLASSWRDSTSTIQRLLDGASARIEVSKEDYEQMLDQVTRAKPNPDLLRSLTRWKLEPMSRRLERIATQTRALADRLEKEVDVVTEPNGVRLHQHAWLPLWSALSHLIRNALDHGIEPASERVAHGKRARGTITLRTVMAHGMVCIEVHDDGRGVDWDAVRERAKQLQLPHQTQRDLMLALFRDGVTTRTSATDVSGRGLGLSAVQAACDSLGGVVVVDSAKGKGTTIRCMVPERAERAAGPISQRVPARHSSMPPPNFS
jgi:two-component system chemotaxis sensor kinase CheA